MKSMQTEKAEESGRTATPDTPLTGGRKKQSLLNGALVLVIATAVVEICGVLYKIPLTGIIGALGRGYTGTAYNIYIPIYNIALAGLPVALSTLVAQKIAEGRFNDVRMVFRVAFRIFLLLGIVGTAILLIVAYPYALSIKSMESLPSIVMIAPAIFICCVMSTYRGYYSGLRNQTPQAVSQVCEVIGKLVFGLLLSWIVKRYAIGLFEAGKPVFGVACATLDEAVTAATPYSAAASILGVTLGAGASLLFLILRHKIVGDKITPQELHSSPQALDSKSIAKMLITLAVPIVVSTLVMNITNLIDSWSIQFRLQSVIDNARPELESIFKASLMRAGVMNNNELKSYIYGSYEVALDFRNLLPTITTALGVSAIPVLSEAWTLKDKPLIKSSVESVIRFSMLIAMPGGFGMAVLAKPLLTLLYGDDTNIPISAQIMAMYGLFSFIMAASTPVTSMLQGIGRSDIPMKSVAIGAVAKVVVNFILVGIPLFNIRGAVIGTFFFYFITLAINIIALVKITGAVPNIKSVFVKPLVCSLICTLTAWTVNSVLSDHINGKVACVIAIVAAAGLYVLSLIAAGAIEPEDIKMLPKGEKINKLLVKYGLIG